MFPSKTGTENNKIIFSIDISGSRAISGKFEFKFDTGSWISGQNWGLLKMNADNMSGTLTSQGSKNNISHNSIWSNNYITFIFNRFFN